MGKKRKCGEEKMRLFYMFFGWRHKGNKEKCKKFIHLFGQLEK